MRTAWCRRAAHYRIAKTRWHAEEGYTDYEVCKVANTEAMYCKQHAQASADLHNTVLEEARAGWAVVAFRPG